MEDRGSAESRGIPTDRQRPDHKRQSTYDSNSDGRRSRGKPRRLRRSATQDVKASGARLITGSSPHTSNSAAVTVTPLAFDTAHKQTIATTATNKHEHQKQPHTTTASSGYNNSIEPLQQHHRAVTEQAQQQWRAAA